jgi:hypothetical protein
MVMLAVLLVTIDAVVLSAQADDVADDLRVDRKGSSSSPGSRRSRATAIA